MQEEAGLAETGRVLSVGYVGCQARTSNKGSEEIADKRVPSDGIARVHGMNNVQAEELVE